jgi:hypothetical protein
MQVINRVGYGVRSLVRVRLGSTERGCEGETCSVKTLSSLRVAEVFRLSIDTFTGVLTLVFYSHVEH